MNLLQFKPGRDKLASQRGKGKAANRQLADCPLISEPVAKLEFSLPQALQTIAQEPAETSGKVQLPPEIVTVQQKPAAWLENPNSLPQKSGAILPPANHSKRAVKAQAEVAAFALQAAQLQQVGLHNQELSAPVGRQLTEFAAQLIEHRLTQINGQNGAASLEQGENRAASSTAEIGDDWRTRLLPTRQQAGDDRGVLGSERVSHQPGVVAGGDRWFANVIPSPLVDARGRNKRSCSASH